MSEQQEEVYEMSADSGGSPSFVIGGASAEVAVVVVTYNSGSDIEPLLQSLRRESVEIALRVIVVDNASTDDTVERVASQPDVLLLHSGGNVGYSAGINVALARVPTGEHVFILNPDSTVTPGALRALKARLESSRAGVAAPKIVNDLGQLFHSIRLEPTLLTSLGDAVFGGHFPNRPRVLSDIDRRAVSYSHAHAVEWVSGAAFLIRSDVVSAIGTWDERYFLYGEETDYLRRVRAAGHEIWFEPGAVVAHRQGGSGTSDALVALMAVNRVRYAEKHRGRLYAVGVRSLVALSELLRSRQAAHRLALATVLSRSSWSDLPHATPGRPAEPSGGAIIIPAHNEASVIGRTLTSLGELRADFRYRILVICNGCTDDTEAVARRFDGVEVLLCPVASKSAALNLGDEVADRWPRLYLDADIEIAPEAVEMVFSALSRSGPDGCPLLEAARPALRYDTNGASLLVRAYFRARSRMPELDVALWGAGAYAINESGHQRFRSFPQVTADDLFVDQVVPAERKAIIASPPVRVRTPRDLANLANTLRRGIRSKSQLSGGSTTQSTMFALLRTVRGPRTALDALAYAGIAALVRLQLRLSNFDKPTWERDLSSR